MNIEHFTRRSALKLRKIADKVLGQQPATPTLSGEPSDQDISDVEQIIETGPRMFSGTWCGDVYQICGRFGEFHLPQDRFEALVKLGAITRSGHVTDAMRDFLRTQIDMLAA